MAVTNYNTVAGQILHEETSGVRTEYVHDAMGSVIATTDANRNVENAYRYSPYGSQQFQTGTNPNPLFLWNGSAAYRVAASPYSDFYANAAHYSTFTGAWSTPAAAGHLRPYPYIECRPASRSVVPNKPFHIIIPPLPILSWKTTADPKPVCSVSGGVNIIWTIQWYLVPLGPGFIIQNVNPVTTTVEYCTGGSISGPPNMFYEAWQVDSKGIHQGYATASTPGTDTWAEMAKTCPTNCIITQVTTAQAGFFANVKLGWPAGNQGLPVCDDYPGCTQQVNKLQHSGNFVTRTATQAFSCCPSDPVCTNTHP